MPLRGVLLRARGRTPSLTSEGIDGEGEEARVFVRLLYLDGIQCW